MEKTQGIYIIGNLQDKRVYIGSSVNLKSRIQVHSSQLKRNVHSNYKLQKAYNKDNTQFITVPIPVKDGIDVKELEQQLLDEFIPAGGLYNIATRVESGMLGRKHTDDAKEKLRVQSTGKKHSEETKAKMKEACKGRRPSEECLKNALKAHKGVPLTPEHKEILRIKSTEAMKDPAARQHLSDVNIGIKHTPETIEKMKEICKGRTFTPQARAASLEANIGRKMSDEHLAIIKAANTGLVRSEETRAKMSLAQKGHAVSQKTRDAVSAACTGRIKTQAELDVCRATLAIQTALQSKKVVVNGVVYNSINDAAKQLNVDKGTIHRRASNDKYPDWKILV